MAAMERFIYLGQLASEHELKAASRTLEDTDRQRMRELAARYREMQFNLLSEEGKEP